METLVPPFITAPEPESPPEEIAAPFSPQCAASATTTAVAPAPPLVDRSMARGALYSELEGGLDDSFDDFDEDDFDDDFDDDFEEEIEGEYELQDDEYGNEFNEMNEGLDPGSADVDDDDADSKGGS